MTDTVQRAKEALWGRYHELNPHIFVDSKAYVNNSKENLLQPEWMEFIKADYEKGSETRKRGQVLNLGISDFLKSTGVIHKKVGPVHESKRMEHTIEL